LTVIPAKAGIQSFQALLDPGFRRGDGAGDSIFLKLTALGYRAPELFVSDVFPAFNASDPAL